MIVGIASGGGILVLVLIVLAVYLINKPPAHTMSAPESAGGLHRDRSAESGLGTNLDSYKRQMRSESNGRIKRLYSAVYSQDTTGSVTTTGQVSILFIGAKVQDINPSEFINGFSENAKSHGGTVHSEGTGSLGGKAACAEISAGLSGQAALCAWADNDTFGEFVPLSQDARPLSKMTDMLARMRPDIEKTK